MPASSQKQFKFMKAAEHNPEFAKKVGISSEKAAEYTKENKGESSYKNLPFRKIKKAMGK